MNIRYTTQSAYEKIRAYFSKPGARIAVQFGDCSYRTEDGRKCAVGCLIPDGLYTESMEGRGWMGAKEALEDEGRGALVEQIFGKVDDDFLLAAQDAHDGQQADWDDKEHVKVGRFLRRLDRLAEEHGLRVAP